MATYCGEGGDFLGVASVYSLSYLKEGGGGGPSLLFEFSTLFVSKLLAIRLATVNTKGTPSLAQGKETCGTAGTILNLTVLAGLFGDDFGSTNFFCYNVEHQYDPIINYELGTGKKNI